MKPNDIGKVMKNSQKTFSIDSQMALYAGVIPSAGIATAKDAKRIMQTVIVEVRSTLKDAN